MGPEGMGSKPVPPPILFRSVVVSRLTLDEKVGGSNPSETTKLSRGVIG